MAGQQAFWIDENFDREHASAGHSRYGDEVERSARRAVTVLVRELNDLLDPIVDQLETDIPADS